jgi:hypothetical protein
MDRISKIIHTEHYSFILRTINNRNNDNIWYSQYLEVGDSNKPCLSLTINTADSNAIFNKETVETAKLSNIEALYNCVLEEDADNLFSKFSFGKELLKWVIEYITSEFKHVVFLQLDDESYIPCNRATNETLDLLTYSIALNNKTWYELNFNAFISNKNIYDRYKKEIDIYSSASTKSKSSWTVFFLKNVTSMYARNMILQDEIMYKRIYEESVTFPEFFRALVKIVGKENKCKFFKGWLQEFINSQISVTRRWIIRLKAEGGSYKNKKSRKSRK